MQFPYTTRFWVIVTVVIIILVSSIILFKPRTSSNSTNFPAVANDKYQAVFLENNQVYFGKVTDSSQNYISLTDVYYLRASDSLNSSNPSQSINLVKLGGEFHGPEDLMYIQKDKILFWENLAPNSSVVKTIISSKK